jgi:hypothetical protein
MSRAFTVVCRVLAVVVGVGILGAPAAVGAVCWKADKPAVVLDCLASAYEARDSVAVRDLYDSNYTEEWPANPKHNPGGRTSLLEQLKRAWGAGVTFLIVDHGSVSVTPGPEADTWVVESVGCKVEAREVVKGKTTTYKYGYAKIEYYVRMERGDNPAYRIYLERVWE